MNISNKCVREQFNKDIEYQAQVIQEEFSLPFDCRNISMETFTSNMPFKGVPVEEIYEMYTLGTSRINIEKSNNNSLLS